MSECILALDLGTSSVRSILFDTKGSLLHVIKEPLVQSFPQVSWVEEDPMHIWLTAEKVLEATASFANLHKHRILCMGITNQRETTVVWNKTTSLPIYPAIVWQDRRTALRCLELKEEGLEHLFTSKTGLLLDPYFSATKLEWILKNVPSSEALSRAKELAFGTVDSWIIWKLTGGKHHITDITNASRTLLFNIHTHKWDEQLLEILNIPKNLLPDVVPSSGAICTITSIKSLENLPITGVAGDQHAALFGQQCFKKGDIKCTYGTGCFILMNTGEKPVSSNYKLLTTIAYQLNNTTYYALEGSVFMGGSLIQWLRDELNLVKSSEESEALALQCSDTNGVYLVPAFTGLGAPYWDPYAKGTLLGITRGTTKAHIARAALEAVAMQVCDVIDVMAKDSHVDITHLKADGGASTNHLLMQMQADFTQAILQLPTIKEITAFGVASLAALGHGIFSNLDNIRSLQTFKENISPSTSSENVLKKRKAWKDAIQCCKKWSELSQEQSI